jgi:hypothetical protein
MRFYTGDIQEVSLFTHELHTDLFSNSRALHVIMHDSLVLFSTFFPSWIKVVLDDPQLTRLDNYQLR